MVLHQSKARRDMSVYFYDKGNNQVLRYTASSNLLLCCLKLTFNHSSCWIESISDLNNLALFSDIYGIVSKLPYFLFFGNTFKSMFTGFNS